MSKWAQVVVDVRRERAKSGGKRVGSRAGLKTGGGDYKFADTRYSSYQIH